MNNKPGPSILAVDWGTSSFRLMHIDGHGRIEAQLSNQRGVSTMAPDELESFLRRQINTLGSGLASLPIVMCGMVGSQIGWQDAGYQDCPVNPQVLSTRLQPLQCDGLRAYIVPGLRTLSPWQLPDVMRGEETQVMGWLSSATAEQLAISWLCLPGTHSKWVQIVDGRVECFATALTGELFAMLRNYSVLARGDQIDDDGAFQKGLDASVGATSLLHLLFSTRSRMLAGEWAESSSASYLSGLLIGAEVAATLAQLDIRSEVHLIGGSGLTTRYQSVLQHFDVSTHVHSGEVLVARGLWQLYQASPYAQC